ncbi:MAG: SCO family protein [Mariprofundaceae bacterium]
MNLMKFVLFAFAMSVSNTAYAAYGSVTQNSDVDPTIVKIKEVDFLGQKISSDYMLVDQNGKEFSFKEMLGKPTILALSYYRCDGACSVLNRNLWNTLQEVEQWKIDKDFNVLTISFDRHDTPATLTKFMDYAGFKDGLPDGWKMTTMKNPEDIKRLTDSIGYKFFWSPRDAIFMHPNVYVMISPKGRVTRYLYGANISGIDMDVSITKSIGEELSPANVINFLIGSCYSYNYKDGKYTVNIPLIIAAGALVFGLMLLSGSMLHMKRRKRKEAELKLLKQA